MIRDIIALIEFIEERLINKRDRIDRNIIKDFVDPVFLLFEEVHNNYLTTFYKYKKKIKSSTLFNSSFIIEEISEDRLFSQNLRSELLSTLSVENELVKNFIFEINEYLQFPKVLFYNSMQPWSNVRRDSLMKILTWIDRLTPELVISSGLLSEIQNSISNNKNSSISEHIFSSLELTIRSSIYESSEVENVNQNSLQEVSNKINEIKKFLAIQCINCIVDRTQEKYNLVIKSYWQIRIKSIGLEPK